MDGEWEAPQIANPKCESAPGCGTWQRPTIDNPNYKGKWKPTMIDNPNYQVYYFKGLCQGIIIYYFSVKLLLGHYAELKYNTF